MIKKIMAMLVAISCAFGAWAADRHISGTDFSTHPAGTFLTQHDDAGIPCDASHLTYWWAGDTEDFGGKVVSNSTTDIYLDFESNVANPLYRTIESCNGAKSVGEFTKRSIGTGLFIDTHVQFTPYLVNDSHLAPTNGAEDKLIVWVRETEVENDANETNLIVTAGYYDAYNNLSASNYVVNISSADVSELCSHTNRLTIKSYSNITDSPGGPAGFVVYLNEHAIEYTADAFATGCDYLDDLAATPGSYYETGHHMLFPSLMGCNLTDYDKLSGVGYAGMGQIYDVIFDDKNTDFPPFVADATDFKVVPGEGVASFVYDNVQYFTEQSLTVPAAVASVTISNVVYSSGWQHKEGTWYNGSTIVSNEYDAVTETDYGTFVLANGTTLNLAGFKPNFTVGGVPYQTLFGGTVTEPTGAFGAAKNGGTIVLNNDILISEGDGQIVVDEYDDLTIDLNGHTIQGKNADATIVNQGGSLTIVDNSVGKAGKVIGCWNYDAENEEWANNYQSLSITELAVANTLDAGTYEFIIKDELNNSLVISNGAYLCVNDEEGHEGEQPTSFYLVGSLATGATYTWSQDTDTGLWYAIVTSGSAPTTYPVTFSTNSVTVAEYTTNITAGATLPNAAIPAFTGGAWDVDPTGAVISAATNFNYTIVPSYTLTYATEYGAVPDGVVYTASTPDFALAAAPVTEVVGIEFAGWVIGSVTNAAGATFVVADHLENTTATAAWVPVVPTGTAIYLTMGSGVNSLSTSFDGTDWTAYSAPLEDVELGSTLYIKGTSSVTGYDVPQFSIVVDDTHATEQTALVVNKSAIVYFPQSSIEQQWADRDGTAAKPFVIRNYADLVALKNGVANGTVTNQCFEQVADIDMDGEEPWAGIGTFECRTAGSGAFEGTYDGGNYAISNVTFDQHEYNGIFAAVVGGVIKNLTVDVDGFAATSAFGGAAIAGVAKNCFLTNLVATGTIIGQSSTPCTHSAAGIAVRMEGTVAYACTNRCEIWSGKGKLGGIAAMGQGDRADSLILCSNEGDIHGTKTGGLGDGGVGGIFGYQGYGDGYQAVTYTNCRNIGQVTSLSSDKTGSILGHHSNSGPSFEGTIITLDNMLVSGYSEGSDGVTYGKSIGGGLVELCTQAEFETNNTYSTLYSGLTPTFAFEAAGTISFKTNLFQATAFAITGPQGYEVTSSEAGGIVTFTCAIPGPADPWMDGVPVDDDAAAAAKAEAIFYDFCPSITNIDTYVEYTNLVDYIKSVTSSAEVPADLTTAQKTYIYQSWMLGAADLFTDAPVISIVSVTPTATAGQWAFNVQVTQGESSTVLEVAAAKVAALVKVRTSLTTGSWAPPASVNAVELLGGHTIQVTVSYGEAASGFMKISD